MKNIRFFIILAGTLLLAGCGGMAPLQRAHDVLFDVPYISFEQKHDELALGIKQLSEPEVHELFCRPGSLCESYKVYYLRAHNVGQHTYFVHLLNTTVPTRKDLETYFNPSSSINTLAHVLMMVPVGYGLARIASDSMTFFLGFLGVNMVTHLVESYALGYAGYEKLAKCAVVSDPDRGTPGLTVLPYRHEHYLLFMPRTDAAHVRLSVARKDMVTKELSFDMSQQIPTIVEAV